MNRVSEASSRWSTRILSGTLRVDRCTILVLAPPATSGATDRQSSSITPASTSCPLNDGPPSERTTPAPRAVELIEDLGRLGPRRRQAHHLGNRPESLHRLGRRRAAGQDHRRVLARAPVGEQREAQIEVEAGGDHRQAGPLGAPRGQPGPAGGRPGPGKAVALGPHRAGRRDDPVGAGPNRREDRLVGRVAECSAGAVDGDGTVGGGDHVDHEPGPSGRLGSSQRRIELHRVDIDDRAGQQSPHAAKVAPAARLPCVGGAELVFGGSGETLDGWRPFTGNPEASGSNPQAPREIPKQCEAVYRPVSLASRRRVRGRAPGRISGG